MHRLKAESLCRVKIEHRAVDVRSVVEPIVYVTGIESRHIVAEVIEVVSRFAHVSIRWIEALSLQLVHKFMAERRLANVVTTFDDNQLYMPPVFLCPGFLRTLSGSVRRNGGETYTLRVLRER